jgi:hypothetical protein
MDDDLLAEMAVCAAPERVICSRGLADAPARRLTGTLMSRAGPPSCGTIGEYSPNQVAVGYWLDPIPPEDMPMLAARMLAELGVWLPGRDADRRVREPGIRHLGLRRRPVPGAARGLMELVLMCWLHGGEEYDLNGGDERLLAAARALASRSR